MLFSKKELWSNLPSDVLKLICSKIKTKSVLVQVCRSWRAVAEDEICRLLRSYGPKSVLLMQPYIVPDEMFMIMLNIVNFGYSMSSEKNENIEKRCVSFNPSQNEIQIIISSCRGGWTFIFREKTKDLELWSPLLDVKIRLPDLSSRVIKAATFFGDFGIGVAVICGDETLAFVKYGDFEWSYLCQFEAQGGRQRQYEDIISSKDSILALSKNGESVQFQAWSFDGTNNLDVKLDFPQDMAETKEPRKYKHKLYIAECEGRVFLVVRWLEKLVPLSTYNCYWTVNFYVYVLDEEKRGWSVVESLGDQSLFVRKNQTALLRAKDFEGCRKNSIYFTDHYPEITFAEKEWDDGYYDFIGVFGLEDSGIKRGRHELENILPSIWIVSGV